MGVNMAGYAIFDDNAVSAASCQEIIRRFFAAKCAHRQGKGEQEAVEKIKLIMRQLNITPDIRDVVKAALDKSAASDMPAAAIELPDGRIVTGKSSELMTASSSVVLNAIKELTNIDDDLTLLSPVILKPIVELKTKILNNHSTLLNLEDVLTALSISGATNTLTARAMRALQQLRDCEFHSTQMLLAGDEDTLRKLGLRMTCEPIYPSKELYF